MGGTHPLRLLCLLLAGSVVLASALVAGARPSASTARTPFRLAAADSDSTLLTAPAFDSLVPSDRTVEPGGEPAIAPETLPPTRPAFGVRDTTDAAVDSPGFPADTTGPDGVNLVPEPLDSLQAASSPADTIAVDSLAVQRALKYFPPQTRPDLRTARPFRREVAPFSAALGSYWRHELRMDSTGRYYIARETVNAQDVRVPLQMDYDTFRRYRLEQDLRENWRQLSNQRAARQLGSNNPFGFSIVVPGGRESAFSTIFGKNEVDLRVSGNADINAGFDYRKSEQQAAFTGQASQVDPTFKQDLRLGITGTIGDKLNVDVNWDTQNQFDYQNQLRLQYTGYEDEIIQSIEAGNVLLQTPSTLIRGGQSLFGIKAQMQVGGVRMTTVASQQEGESNNLSIDGGSETVDFQLRPTDYDDDTHFFLSYYFRNRWNDALSQPPNILVAHGFDQITDLEVWKLTRVQAEDENVRQAVAVVDLGERVDVLQLADQYTEQVVPTEQIDQYTDLEVDQQLRRGDGQVDFLRQKGLSSSDYQIGRFKRLERNRDYQLDPVLGYVTLRSRLQDDEALAVSYRIVAGGQLLRVGDLSTETGGSAGGQRDDKLVLKLLRPVSPRQPSLATGFNPAAWYLEMRNIYRLGAGLQPTEFDLQILYEPPGKTASKTIPEVAGRTTLLQALGLDRLNTDGAPNPDDRFDYLRNFTIDPQNGYLIFPFLEPFGDRIAELVQQSGGDMEQAQRLYIFDALYSEKKENARRDSQKDVYRIRGSYKGAGKSVYDLGAWAGLIEGSVRVTSGGSQLQEGTDYIVDYQSGSVTIINNAYLTSGRDINITYEENQLVNLQKKTLLGFRADYGDVQDPLKVGATMMRLSQKSPIDKFRLGEEPISNMIWGVDGRVDLQPRWLTRAIDMLPFIQTRELSSIQITGEFAQLRPSHVQTTAFERSRRDLQKNNRDFKSDELRGISYIDDFEGFENTFSLKQPGAWMLSSAPDSIGVIDPLPGDPRVNSSSRFDSLRTNWRASLGWYTINSQLIRELGTLAAYDQRAVIPPHINDVFPNRDVRAETGDRSLSTMDLYFAPQERGPYNYTRDLPEFFRNPKSTWGGMTQRLPQGYTDFTLKNIEFVEFVFRPFPENPEGDAGPDAKLYVDLGSISEDIIPNQRLNTEDGLSTTSVSSGDLDNWSREARGTQNQAIDINKETRQTEDVGLDGLASSHGNYDPMATEFYHFRNFLDALDENAINDPRYRAEVAKARQDPSGDDYHYFNSSFFNSSEFYPAEHGALVQQRFSRFFPGTELNSYEGQREFGSGNNRGNARYPDTEDLNGNSTIDLDNSYFQYEVPLSKAILDEHAAREGVGVGDYVVTEIEGESGPTGWYQIRIPVRDYSRKVGDAEDFSRVESIRLWTTGNEVPITIRFATLELVGSQWQKSDRVAQDTTSGVVFDSEAHLSISSINNEENFGDYLSPEGTVISQMRLPSGQTQNAREQSMVLRVQDMGPGQQRAIFKTFQALDLLKYEHVRMFVHMHGRAADGMDLSQLPREEGRSKARLFIRLGANETNDFYEYEQPLTPSPPSSINSDALWQTRQDWNGQLIDLNSVNISLAHLNQLKFERDSQVFPQEEVFWNLIETDEGLVRQGPDISAVTPPGTRIAVKGNPSLAKVNTIVIGIRNPADPHVSSSLADVLEDVSVWVNELRVSGYDETNGWAAVMNADVKLADLGRIRANINRQTDGFGSLSSSLGERQQTNIQNWGVTSELFVDKFIPERYGWTLPVNVQYQSNTTTPRFSPQRGDIRVDEILAQIDEREDLTSSEKEQQKAEAIDAAQTASVTRSITTRVAKRGSRSKLLRNTVDNLSLSYSYSDADASTPQLQLNDSWRWSSALNYTFRMQPKTIRPLWFLDDLPLLGFLGDINFNYAPNNLSFGGSANRNFSETKERLRLQPGEVLEVPELVQFPLRQGHTFSHRRQFDLGYNPLTFLSLTLSTNTNQSLNAVGVDTVASMMVLSDSLTNQYATYDNLDVERALAQGLIDSNMIDRTAFQLDRLAVTPTDRVLSRIFSGQMPRTEQYQQRFTATFQPKFNRFTWLNWMQIAPIQYNATFNWTNGPVGRLSGANVSTEVRLQGGLTFRPQELFRNFDFYTSLEQEQRASESRKRQALQQRDADRQRRREERVREREHRREVARLEALVREDSTVADSVQAVIQRLPGARRAPDLVEAPADSAVADTSDGGGFRIPLPNFRPLLRQTVLAITGIRDLNVQYTNTRRGASSNVGEEGGRTFYSFYDSFRGHGPSIGYRFGFQNRIPVEDRVLGGSLQVTDAISQDHRIQGRTMLTPNQNLQITLNWNTDWATNENVTFNQLTGEGVGVTITDGGNNNSSIWAFGASYLDVFRKQRERFDADARAADLAGNRLDIRDANGDGVALSNATVANDFISAFVLSPGTLDSRGILPFPMPSWNVTYSGIGNWPIIRRLVQNASLKHGYSGRYSTDFRTNIAGGAGDSLSYDIAGRRVTYPAPQFDVGSIRISEQFTPLIGADLTWKGAIQTGIAWNKSNTYSMSTSNFELGHQQTNQFDLTASYFKQGMRLPFFGRVQNRISFNLSLAYSQTADVRYPLKTAMRDYINKVDAEAGWSDEDAASGDNISVLTEISRYSVTPRIAYNFSQRLQADFSLKYERFVGDSRQPSFTSVTGGFNVRVSIMN